MLYPSQKSKGDKPSGSKMEGMRNVVSGFNEASLKRLITKLNPSSPPSVADFLPEYISAQTVLIVGRPSPGRGVTHYPHRVVGKTTSSGNLLPDIAVLNLHYF